MEIFIILVLVIAVVLIIGYPLVNPPQDHRHGVPLGSKGENKDLYGRREIVLDALSDLQFEFATGKLSAGDYEQLKGRYELEAAEVMQQIDTLKLNRSKTAQRTRACPRCGASLTARDKFCAKCGAKL